MDIKDCAPSDIHAVLEIETRSFQNPWGRESFLTELSCKKSIRLVIREKETDSKQAVIGYMFGRLIEGEIYILKLAVAENWRRRGVASRLLEESLRRTRENNAFSAVLDVRSSNQPAISFYKKHGFQMVGIRPKYYSDNGEDALVMRKNFKEDV